MNSCIMQEALSTWTPSYKRQTVFLTPWNDVGRDAEEEFNNDLSRPRKRHSRRDCTKRTAFLADKVSRHYCPRFGAGLLHRKSGIHEGTENFLSETLHALASSEDSSQKCLEISGSSSNRSSSKTHQEAAGNRLQSNPETTQQAPQETQEAWWNLLRRTSMNLKLISEFKDSTRCSYWRSRKNDQNSSVGG